MKEKLEALLKAIRQRRSALWKRISPWVSPTLKKVLRTLWSKPESAMDQVIERLVRKGDVAFDLGANLGVYTSALSRRVGPKGAVYAFEPNPELSSLLKQRILSDGLGNCRIVSAAVSRKSGEHITFYVDDRPGMNSVASTIVPQLANEERLGSRSLRTCSVETIDLDSFCRERALRPSFLKIDTEGAEESVLLGFDYGLRRIRPFIVLEYGNKVGSWQPPTLEILERNDYDLFDIEAGKAIRADEYSKRDIPATNILAIPRERRRQVRLKYVRRR